MESQNRSQEKCDSKKRLRAEVIIRYNGAPRPPPKQNIKRCIYILNRLRVLETEWINAETKRNENKNNIHERRIIIQWEELR